MKLPKVFRKVMDAIQGPAHVAGAPSATDRLYGAKNEMSVVQTLPQTSGGGLQKDEGSTSE